MGYVLISFVLGILAMAVRLVWEGHVFSGLLLALGLFGFISPLLPPPAGSLLRHID